MSDLLGSFLESKHIRSQVVAAQVVERTNTWLETLLPSARRGDACALSFIEGVVVIGCTSSAVASFVMDHMEEGLGALAQAFPSTSIQGLRTRMVSELYPHEF